MENKFEQIKTVASRNSQILACGGAFNNAMRAMMKEETDYIEQKMKEELGIIDIESSLTTIGAGSFMTLIDESAFKPPKEDILSLKKRIKHCKNHMEKQRLHRELNALYKEQKRRK